MSVSKISSHANAHQANQHQGRAGVLRNDFRRLLQSIKDGNLADARKSYAVISHTLPDLFQALSGQLTQDYRAIGDALAKNDISGARQAVVKLQQDLQSIGRSSYQQRFDINIDDARHSPSTASDLFCSYNDNIELPAIGTHIDIKI